MDGAAYSLPHLDRLADNCCLSWQADCVCNLGLGFAVLCQGRKNSILGSHLAGMSGNIAIAINQFRHQKCNPRNSKARTLRFVVPMYLCTLPVATICLRRCQDVKATSNLAPGPWSCHCHCYCSRHPFDPLKHVTGGGQSSSISCRS